MLWGYRNEKSRVRVVTSGGLISAWTYQRGASVRSVRKLSCPTTRVRPVASIRGERFSKSVRYRGEKFRGRPACVPQYLPARFTVHENRSRWHGRGLRSRSNCGRSSSGGAAV